MNLNRVTRKVRLDSRLTAVRYQLITELVFLRKQSIIDTDLTYLTLLGTWGPTALKDFCNRAVRHVFGYEDLDNYPVRVQAVRNRLNLLEKRGFIVKEGKSKKVIKIAPGIALQNSGDILLEYSFIYVETKESKEPTPAVSSGVGVN
jgi:hypothetical protein